MHRKSRLQNKLWQMPTRSQVRHQDSVHYPEEPTHPGYIYETSHNGRDRLDHAASAYLPSSLPGTTLPRSHSPGQSKEDTSKLMLCSFMKSCATSSFLLGSGHFVCSSSKKGSNRRPEKPGWPSKKLESPAATSMSTV